MKKFFCIFPIFFIIFYSCATPAPMPEEIAKADYGEYPDDYQLLVIKYLQDTLIDPTSLINLKMGKPKKCWTTFKGNVVYGYVLYVAYNAKNRYGGYVGQKEYLAFIRDNHLVIMAPLAVAGYYHVVD